MAGLAYPREASTLFIRGSSIRPATMGLCRRHLSARPGADDLRASSRTL